MSVAASEAPQPPLPEEKQGFELPNWAEKIVIPLVVLAIAISIPFFTDNQSFLQQCAVAVAYVVMALGLNIVVGFAGLLDLGYVAFFAIGAFCVGWFASGHFAYVNNEEGIHFLVGGTAATLPGIHLNFFVVIVIAMILTAMAGVIIGLPTLRLRGDYIAIVTLAFGEIIVPPRREPATRSTILGGTPVTAGRQGISPVDRIDLPFLDPFTVLDKANWYWFALFLMCIVLFVNFRLRDSRRAARGSRCARTRSPRWRWACQRSRRSCSPTRRAPRSAASRARSWARC